MKIFISWSGDRSKAVAELLHNWIKCVLQMSEPWVSTQNIDGGSTWFTEINDQLSSVSTGIVCLTQENKNNPWILFEAGALAKGLAENRLYTFLIDLQHVDIKDPLAQFNHTLPTHDGVFKLIKSINSRLGKQALPDFTLQSVFTTFWPQFEADFTRALEKHKPQREPRRREDNDMLTEILEVTRSLASRMRDLENRDSNIPVGQTMLTPSSFIAFEVEGDSSELDSFVDALDHPQVRRENVRPNTFLITAEATTAKALMNKARSRNLKVRMVEHYPVP
jgi:hypothetical protein